VTDATSESVDDTCLLDADIRFARTGWGLDVAFRVPPGGVLALLGPNGSGKTTALQIMAGILPLQAGHVQIGGQCWDDASTGRRLPTHDRSLGLVFQDHLLFPRMSIRDNIAFGLRARAVTKTAAREQADSWLARVGLLDKADRRPGQLSGGQAQLVALARALATNPQLLLLDEPLTALDAGTRMHVRSDLRRHLAGYAGATVLVTHDPLDALVLADRVVVIEHGQVVQTGTPKQITQKPRTRYVAQLVGLNLLHGQAAATIVTLADGSTLTTAEPAHGPVFVVVRPSSIALHREHPSGSPRNVWPGTITGIEQHGDLVRLAVAGPPDTVADVTPAAIGDLDLAVGARVWLSVKATDLAIHPDA
jgi:molybdate transport system ATP-binding protein